MKATGIIFLLALGLTTICNAQMAKSLFDGESLAGWVEPDTNLFWTAHDGILSAQSDPDKKGSILWTEKSFRDFSIELDFKMGKGTVDSGVFLREINFQIQIGESGSLKRDMTASPYIPGKGYPVEASGVADLLQQDDWNSLKIEAIGKTATVWLNSKEVMTYTTEEGPEEGAIGLQLHPNRDMSIDFRNIQVTEIN